MPPSSKGSQTSPPMAAAMFPSASWLRRCFSRSSVVIVSGSCRLCTAFSSRMKGASLSSPGSPPSLYFLFAMLRPPLFFRSLYHRPRT